MAKVLGTTRAVQPVKEPPLYIVGLVYLDGGSVDLVAEFGVLPLANAYANKENARNGCGPDTVYAVMYRRDYDLLEDEDAIADELADD